MKRKLWWMSWLLACHTLWVSAMPATQEAEQEEAIALYKQGDYPAVVAIYENMLLKYGESFELFYNLGNAHYKSQNFPKAIFYYEKARKLAPNDEDLLFNLELANQHVIDKFEEVPVFFLKAWADQLYFLLPSNTLAITSLVTFNLALLSFFLFISRSELTFRKLALQVAGASLAISLVAGYAGFRQMVLLEEEVEAIIFESSVQVKSMPDEKGTQLFVIHEGSKVRVLEENGIWKKIRMKDGNVGWVPATALGII